MDTTEECFRKAFLKELAFKLAWENMNRLHLWVDGVKGIARRESGGCSMCRGTEVWYSPLWRGNKILHPLKIGAEGTLPVGGSRGLDLVVF